MNVSAGLWRRVAALASSGRPACCNATSRASDAAGPCATQIGYLVSATRAGMGAFSLNCLGCECIPRHSPFPHLHPYPLVQTDANRHSDETFRRLNATVTTTTAFVALVRPLKACFVQVKHVSPSQNGQPKGAPSRIRIDSLFLRPLDLFDFAYIAAKADASSRRKVHRFFNETAAALESLYGPNTTINFVRHVRGMRPNLPGDFLARGEVV